MLICFAPEYSGPRLERNRILRFDLARCSFVDLRIPESYPLSA